MIAAIVIAGILQVTAGYLVGRSHGRKMAAFEARWKDRS